MDRRGATRAATLLLSAFVSTGLFAESSFQEFVQVVDRPYTRVGLTITVTDRRGNAVQGLTAGDFTLFEDGREMELADFGIEGDRADRPLSVAVLLDLSRSMRSQVKMVREAAGALLRGLRPDDAIMVASFNDQLTVLLPYTSDPLEPERSLKIATRARGGTALFRSIEETLKDLRSRPGRKVILVISDGLDNEVSRENHILHSIYLQDLLRLCFRTGTVVYGIRPGMAATSWLPFESFVEETGGRLLYTGVGLEGLFARLGEEFLSQYYLAYDIDPTQREEKRRRIRVEVNRPDVMVRAMRGYLTPRSHLETLLADLRDEDEGMRVDAAYELGFIGEPAAAEALTYALRDDQAAVRRMAVDSLARLGDAGSAVRIIRMLIDRDPDVQEAAAGAIIVFGTEAIPPLTARVLKGAGKRKSRALLVPSIKMLGRVGDDRALPPLEAVLAEGPEDARVAAAEALGELGLSGGIPSLRAALGDPNPEIRIASIRAIVAIAGAAAHRVVEDYIARESDPSLKRQAGRLLEAF